VARILIVEDDAYILTVVESVLANAGFEVRTSETAEAAVHVLDSWRPDLLLSDLSLPGMSGIELIRYVRRQAGLAALPIVLMTAHLRDHDKQARAWTDELRLSRVLGKPFPVMRVPDVLREVLAESGTQAEDLRPEEGPAASTGTRTRGRPDAMSLARVARLWSRSRTGVLQTDAGKARLHAGEAVSRDDRAVVVDALYGSGELSFREEVVPPPRRRARLGSELLVAARASSDERRVLDRLDSLLVSGPGSHRADALPLSDDTRRLLTAPRDAATTLGALLATHDILATDVAAEFAALVELGLYNLRRAYRAPAGLGRPSLPPEAAETRPSVQRAPMHRAAVQQLNLRRIRKEIERLEPLDDLELLGLKPGASRSQIAAAFRKHQARYAAAHETADPAARELTAKILALFEQAMRRQLLKRTAGQQALSPADLLARGRNALAVGNHTRALRYFQQAAELAPRDPRVIAYLGVVLAEAPATRARAEEGRKLVLDAYGQQPGDTEIADLVARVLELDG